MQNNSSDKIQLVIRSREGKVFEGAVTSLSAENESGPFDILPSHANFITIIREGLQLRKENASDPEIITFNNAVLQVKDNSVMVFVEK